LIKSAENSKAKTGLNELRGPKTDRSMVFRDLTRNIFPKTSNKPRRRIKIQNSNEKLKGWAMIKYGIESMAKNK
jgi:hypothetical protein